MSRIPAGVDPANVNTTPIDGLEPAKAYLVRFLTDMLTAGHLELPLTGRIEGANGAGYDVGCCAAGGSNVRIETIPDDDGGPPDELLLLEYPINITLIDHRRRPPRWCLRSNPRRRCNDQAREHRPDLQLAPHAPEQGPARGAGLPRTHPRRRS